MIFVVAVTAFLTAALTLFSGFGLGSLLLPAFLLFFDTPIAVAATAVVHLANNLFKAGMLGKFADLRVVITFGIPGALAAFLGARALEGLASTEALTVWYLGERANEITPDGLAIGGLILFFALFELMPRTRELALGRKWLALGGAISGFFGGLSGHQGALRSIFLLRLGLPKETYIATGVLCAVVIDLVRISVYAISEFEAGGLERLAGVWDVVLAGTLAAFAGSYLGRRFMKKVTMQAIHLLVGVLLVLLGTGIAIGLL